jgi:hypothetical protein
MKVGQPVTGDLLSGGVGTAAKGLAVQGPRPLMVMVMVMV